MDGHTATARTSIRTQRVVGNDCLLDQIRTEFVTLVDDGPQSSAFRLEAQSVRVSKATCENAPASARAIDLPNRRPILLRFDAVLSDCR